MTDLSRGAAAGGAAARVGSALVVLLAAAVAAFVVLVGKFRMAMDCPGFDDEGVIAAPESLRSALICTDTGSLATFWLVLPAGALFLVAVVEWLRRRRFRELAVWCAALVAVPLLTTVGTTYLASGDCSQEEWSRHGVEGCERNVELRIEYGLPTE